jgi:hypothetical protein
LTPDEVLAFVLGGCGEMFSGLFGSGGARLAMIEALSADFTAMVDTH